MKYALLLALLAGCSLVYVHQEHPQLWQRLVHTTEAVAADIKSLWQKDQPAPTPVAAPAVVVDPMAATRGWTSITTQYGQTIAITKVTSVDAHSVHYETANGAGSVEISDLPSDAQQALGYDPVAGQQAAAAEQAREMQSDEMAAKVAAVEQAKERYESANLDGIVSDGDYASAESDLNSVSSHVVVDSVTGYVSGDTYWVQRYWDDRRRKESYERQRAAREREQVAVMSRDSRVAVDDQHSGGDRRTETYGQSSGSTSAFGSPQRSAPATSESHTTSPAAPVSRPAPAPVRGPVTPNSGSNP